jgi:hypothetical protein
MDSRPWIRNQLAAAQRLTGMNAKPAEPAWDESPAERKERIFALEELHKVGILHHDEFDAEMKRLTDPQPTPDPVSAELHHQRRRRLTRIPDTHRLLAWLPMVAHER